MVQIVKNQPDIKETQSQPLGQEDALEQETTTHRSVLAWRIPWTSLAGYSSQGRVDMTERPTLSLSR